MKRIGSGMFRLNRKQNILSVGKTKVTAKAPEAILSQHEAFCFGQMKCILLLEIAVRNTGISVEKNSTLKNVTSKNCRSKILVEAKEKPITTKKPKWIEQQQKTTQVSILWLKHVSSIR